MPPGSARLIIVAALARAAARLQTRRELVPRESVLPYLP